MEQTVNQINYVSIAGKLRLNQFIHYGSSIYYPHKVNKPIKNQGWLNKPVGGLWTSPIDSNKSWENFCKSEGLEEFINKPYFIIKLKQRTKLLVINSYKNIKLLPTFEGIIQTTIDFINLANYYDAIWLTDKGQIETRFSSPISLHGWDCETLLIINPNCCYQI